MLTSNQFNADYNRLRALRQASAPSAADEAERTAITKRLTGTGRRVFRIAPIHHHFEMLGWEQVTVVIRFWIITGLCVAAGLGVFYAEWVAGI